MGLLLWVHRNQITVGCKELAGHLKSRHPFTQTVVLHAQVLSLWALVRDHFGGWKNRSLFLISGCQSHHVWSVDDPCLQNDRGGKECGLGLRVAFPPGVREEDLAEWFWHSLCSQHSHLGFSEMPSLLSSDLPSSLLLSFAWSPTLWSSVRCPTLHEVFRASFRNVAMLTSPEPSVFSH